MKWMIAAVLLVLAMAPGQAWARTKRKLAYSNDKVYGTTLRYLRVENNFRILESNKDGGFVVFEFVNITNGATSRASIEIIHEEKAPNECTAIVSIDKLDSIHEAVLLDGLEKKLKADYGGTGGRGDQSPGGDNEVEIE
ncbi:MAG: hypothetical protein GMKNLPBB_02153 [Myxococcota bacterium]|nr:hypothetical protein [Myxococcota bacterium]